MNPLYPALKRLPFPGFKAYSLQTGKALQSGPRSKPCKRQTASAAGHGNSESTMDVTDHRVLLLETICVSPVSFLGLCSMGNPGSERSEGERGRVSHAAKAKKTGGESMLKEEVPRDRLPVDYGLTEYLR